MDTKFECYFCGESFDSMEDFAELGKCKDCFYRIETINDHSRFEDSEESE